ncbi:SRPBCC family protein [Chloroflexota bacterium]
MIRISKETTLKAPLEAVFSYIADPINWPEFWSSLVRVTDVETLPNGGYRANFEYKMAGRLFTGSGEYTEFIPNQLIVIKTKGGVKSTMTWTFQSSAKDETGVTFMVEYNIPNPLLKFLAEPIITHMNEQDAQTLLNNLVYRFMFWNSIYKS